jgi:hypothetical protein
MRAEASHVRTADVLGALSLAADLAIGLPEEHVLRSCYIGMRLAEELSVTPAEQVDLYYAELLMDAGCTAWTSQLAAFLLSAGIRMSADLPTSARTSAARGTDQQYRPHRSRPSSVC